MIFKRAGNHYNIYYITNILQTLVVVFNIHTDIKTTVKSNKISHKI